MNSEQIRSQFDEVSSKYDSQRPLLIPCFDDFYQVSLPLVKAHMAAKKVLDLGAGTGLFSYFVYQARPDLEFTLVDLSDEMLEVARERFAGLNGFQFQQLDYAAQEWSGNYDLIISGLSIHHLEHADKERLYQKVYQSLNPGGLFINADQVEGRSHAFDHFYKKSWEESIERSGLSRQALDRAYERIKLDKFAPLETQLRMLEKAGFTEVDCIYKNLNFVVFCALKDH